MDIREAGLPDEEVIRQIHLDAFGGEEGRAVSDLAVNVLRQTFDPPVLNLVVEIEGELAGHVAFSPVRSKENQELAGYILAPLAVAPRHQKRGIGTKIVEEGMSRLVSQGVGVILVYGDPEYYGRFGFEAEPAENYLPPFPLQYPFGWQAMLRSNRQPAAKPLPLTCVEPLIKADLW